jgi:hypothetical protein
MDIWRHLDLVGGNLREFDLEGQRTRQRYFCVHNACHYAAFRVLSMRAAAAADEDQESKDANHCACPPTGLNS